jgi:acetylglutamate kinase
VRDAAGARIAELTAERAETLIDEGTIEGGMVPKVRAAIRSLGNDPTATARIADGRPSGALARALAPDGGGTRVRLA